MLILYAAEDFGVNSLNSLEIDSGSVPFAEVDHSQDLTL